MERKWWTLVAVCTGTFMLLLDVTIVVVAIPDIQDALHATFGQIQWVIDAYALTLASLLLTAGVLADRYGRRFLFGIGLVIFTAGSLLCGLAQTPLMLILSRSGQGVGGAIMFATSLALLGDSFRGKDRGVAFGAWGAVTGVAVSLGPILGGVITTGISWRGIFLVNVPIGVAALAVTWWRVDESRAPHPGRPDWIGFALLTTGLVGLVYGLIRASETSWGDSGVAISLVLGGILLAGFVIAEATVTQPDVRSLPLPGAHLRWRAHRGVLHERVPLFHAPLPRALSPGRPWILGSADWFAPPADQRADSRDRHRGGSAQRARSGPMADRSRSRPGRSRVDPHGRPERNQFLDPPDSRIHHLGRRGRIREPALASTAIGVVEPQRAGMASGVNTTFRQIGIAVSIAALGTIFSSSLRHNLDRLLSVAPQLKDHAQQIVAAIREGQSGAAFAAVPPALRGQLGQAVKSSFASGINDLLIVTGVLALVGAVASMLLIRNRDFVSRQPMPPPDQEERQPESRPA